MEVLRKLLKSFSQILHTTCHIIKCNLEVAKKAVRYTSLFSLSMQTTHRLSEEKNALSIQDIESD